MYRSSIILAAGTVALLAGTVAAAEQPGQTLPTGQRPYKPAIRATPTAVPTPRVPVACKVDPAVRSLTLTKVGGDKRRIQATIEVVNLGPDSWRSGVRQQTVTLTLRNGNTGAVYTRSFPLPATAARGAVMLRHTTPVLNDPFDTFEFAGTADVSIAYDPDIAIDGNNCNDDTNPGNNGKRLVTSDIQAFLGNTTITSRTW
jgi:hypothetical protein